MARLDHPGILPLKDARFIDGHFVMVFPLGEETLEDRASHGSIDGDSLHRANGWCIGLCT